MKSQKLAEGIKVRRLTLGLFLVDVALLLPQQASSYAPLTGTWSCGAYGSCLFQVTSHNHPAYQWNFGDGNFSGIQTSASIYHTYNIPADSLPHYFQVYLIAYGTVSGGSPDNIVGCAITAYRSSAGGDPTHFSGTCDG